MDELKPCPFCGGEAEFPESINIYGACYNGWCPECGIVEISIQIIDCFDYSERKDVHYSWDKNKMQYGIKYIEVARQRAIDIWNQRIDTK